MNDRLPGGQRAHFNIHSMHSNMRAGPGVCAPQGLRLRDGFQPVQIVGRKQRLRAHACQPPVQASATT